MKTRLIIRLLASAVMFGSPITAFAARSSDLQPVQKRQAVVTNAEKVAQKKAPAPLPGDLISPFNPPDFDKPEGSDSAQRPGTATPANTPPVPAQPAVPVGDREILQALAAQLTPTGTIQIGDAPRLVMGSKRFEVGTRFTVTFNGQDYELELVAIDRTTFTLRYRGEEITRPIKTVR